MICQQILWVEQETPDPEGCFQNDVDDDDVEEKEEESERREETRVRFLFQGTSSKIRFAEEMQLLNSFRFVVLFFQ